MLNIPPAGRRPLLLLVLLAASASAAQPDATDLDTRIGLVSEQLADTTLVQETRDSLTASRDALVGQARASDSLRTAGRSSVDDPAAADADPETGVSWLVLVAGIAALLGLGGGAYWYTQRRDAPAVRTSVRTSSSRLPMTGAERTAQDIASGTATFYATSAQVDTLSRQVEQQRRELDEMRTWITNEYNQREAQRAMAAAPAPIMQAPAPPVLSPADDAAVAFADWCRRATPMMSKVDFFANALAERLPGTSVRAVYRDLNSQAEPVRFDGSGGASPAEFWLVTVGGEALVFPQPLNAHQFRDLTRIFDGTATPASLASVVPARVRDEGAAFALVTPGRVS